MRKGSSKIAISLGCPAGIGPEVIIKSLNYFKKLQPELLKDILIVGDRKVLLDTANILGLSLPEVEVLSISELSVSPGRPTLDTSKAMAQYVKTAIELAKKGEVGAIVTAPITKEGLVKAGVPYAGHTDWLAKELGVKDYVMAFYGEKMIVSLVTTHIPLKDVTKSITPEKILSVVRLSQKFLNRLGKKHGKIALCGLNPHAGEGGLLGDEEQTVIKKALDLCKKEGLNVYGPFPSDSLFYWVYKGKYDLVVALYHDQGLIPFKLLHFEDGVNITLGLPVIRTSPCHGTAYDIAGKGIANPRSFISALKLAYRLLN